MKSYKWYADGSSRPARTPKGVVAVWTAATSGTHQFRLHVEDQGGLPARRDLLGGGPVIRRLDDERGSAIILAIVLMTMMVAVGLAAYSVVDTQQTESMRSRQRESSFNLAEAALNSQSFVLSRRWAGAATSFAGTTPTCSNSSGAAVQCPDPASSRLPTTAPTTRPGRPGRPRSTTTAARRRKQQPVLRLGVIEAKDAAAPT